MRRYQLMYLHRLRCSYVTIFTSGSTALFISWCHSVVQEFGQDLAEQVREVGRVRLADHVTREVERSIVRRMRLVVESGEGLRVVTL
jgi:hypothetical protein